jgi:quercetin dioxygenase-like cupin family protein
VRALQVSFDAFFEGLDVPDPKPYLLRRRNEYEPFEKEEAVGFLYHAILNGSVSNVAVQAVVLDLQPGSQREAVTTDGYEFKYLLKGEVEYQLGADTIVMRQGDSLFFDGRIPHVPMNRTQEPASMLVLYLLPANGNGS